MKFKMFLAVMVFGLVIFVFSFPASAQSVNLSELEKLAAICLKKGNPADGGQAVFLEKTEQISADAKRILYLTVYFVIFGDVIHVRQIDFREEKWTTVEGGTEIPHNFMDDAVFERFRRLDRLIIKQRIIRDGGLYGDFDGKVDFAGERIATLTINGEVIDLTYLLTPSEEEAARLYGQWVKEMLEAAGPYEENGDENKKRELF